MFPFEMKNSMFPFNDEFNYFAFQDNLSSTNLSSGSVNAENLVTEVPFCGVEEWGESGGNDYDISNQGKQQQPFLDYMRYDDSRFHIFSPPFQPCLEDITKTGEIHSEIQAVGSKKENICSFSLKSLQLLNSYSNGFKQNGRAIEPSNLAPPIMAVSDELSTEEIMRIAGSKFIKSSCQTVDFDCTFSGLSDEDTKKVELVESLLASAEKISNQEFDSAGRLLKLCCSFSSHTGNPVQRVVHYFAEALRERIDIETGKMTSKGFGKKQLFDIENAMMTPNPTVIANYQLTPFCQIAHFAGIQAIVENVAFSERIHIIDLAIRNGFQWTVLMQDLVSRSDCPLELLKITAIATISENLIMDTGERLTSFAETMNLPFSFNVVVVSDLMDLKEDLLELEETETVAVYSGYIPRSFIALPNRMDSIMKMIRNINPCVMVVAEVETNHNSPSFVHRFIETLFFYSAYFDCLDAFMERGDKNRMILESMYFGKGIMNSIATEGDERMIRSVNLDVWREFFARFGMEETDLSSSSLFQAELIINKFASGDYCTLDKNGKSLVVGWKGTPLHSLSAWKFILDEEYAI